MGPAALVISLCLLRTAVVCWEAAQITILSSPYCQPQVCQVLASLSSVEPFGGKNGNGELTLCADIPSYARLLESKDGQVAKSGCKHGFAPQCWAFLGGSLDYSELQCLPLSSEPWSIYFVWLLHRLLKYLRLFSLLPPSSTHLPFFLLLILPLSLSPGWPQILCITEAAFLLLILLPPSARYWDYRTEPLGQLASFFKIN